VFLPIHGDRHDRWRAVEQAGHVLDSLVPRRRDKKTATKFVWKRLKGLTYVPRVIIMEKLKSYGAAKREIVPEGTIASIALSTIVRRIRTTPRVSGSGGGNSVSHRDRPRDSSLHMVLSPNTFDLAVSALPPPNTVPRGGKDSGCGGKARARLWPRKGRARGSPPTSTPCGGIGTHRLTMPTRVLDSEVVT
jgi:DDE domain